MPVKKKVKKRTKLIGKKQNHKSGIDWMLLINVAILVFFGLIMLYSASSYSAGLSGDQFSFLKRQAVSIGVGVIAMLIMMYLPYDRLNKKKNDGKKLSLWAKLTIIFYVISLAGIFVVLTSWGVESHGARRWINLGMFTLQPAEIVKVTLILVVAALICGKINKIGEIKTYISIIIFPVAGMGLVAYITDDLGTAIIIILIGLVMIYVASPQWKYVVGTALVVVVGGIGFLFLESFRMDRIKAWLHLEEYAADEGYQITQALNAIGSGGFFGKGIGKSTQKMGFIPESQNDMIFSIVCEELGIIGGILLIILIVFLLWRMKKIYDETMDLYGRVIVAGVASHIGFQTIINLGVVTNLIPNTGVPLPFISYGGSAIIFTLAEIGMVLSVCRANEKQRYRVAMEKAAENRKLGSLSS